MKTEVKGKLAAKLGGSLVLNTVVAIVIGLVVANVIQPGTHGKLEPPAPKVSVKSFFWCNYVSLSPGGFAAREAC